jgi:sugar diacid utilization regulator
MGTGAVPSGPLSDDAKNPDLDELTQAVEEGASFPAITRAAARALNASLAVVDRSSVVLAVAALSPDEENKLRARGAGISRRKLRLGGETVGELRIRWRGEEPTNEYLLGLVGAILSLELERQRADDWAEEDAAADLVRQILARELTGVREINEATAELGADLSPGCGVVIGRLRAKASDLAEGHEKRALTAALRGLRSVSRGALGMIEEITPPDSDGEAEEDALPRAVGAPGERVFEIRAILPVADTRDLDKAAIAAATELDAALPEVEHTFGASRRFERADDLFRAGREALLALNVGEAEGMKFLAIEETGSYRLLLAGMSEDPSELQWFYEDTVAPIIAYDEQYGTDLLATVETFLKNDGNIAPTADELFTHRHTIRYRLGRVRDLCGYDIQSTDGRERLGFGLKVMRVLGLGPRGRQQS